MTLDFQKKRAVKIKMLDCIKSMADDSTRKLKEKATAPVAEHLLKVDENCKKLERQRAKEFHNMVAQRLHVIKQSRADIQPAMAFMCTRVKDPDEDDWKKLCGLIAYLKDMLDSCLTLKANQHKILAWHVDASHGAHADDKGHTGGALTMG